MNNQEFAPLTIDLAIGHTDLKGVTHRSVTFGYRITGKKLFEIDDDPQSNLATQYNDLLLRVAITEFGSLKMPVPLSVLLNLDSIDRDDLKEAFDRFLKYPLAEGDAGTLVDNKVRLALGFERNGLTYDVVEFGTRLIGMDEVEADQKKLEGLRRVCFFAGKQVVRLSQSKGSSALEGPMPLEYFEYLDVVDIEVIRAASEVYRNSFRRPGARISQIGRSDGHPVAGNGDGVA